MRRAPATLTVCALMPLRRLLRAVAPHAQCELAYMVSFQCPMRFGCALERILGRHTYFERPRLDQTVESFEELARRASVIAVHVHILACLRFRVDPVWECDACALAKRIEAVT